MASLRLDYFAMNINDVETYCAHIAGCRGLAFECHTVRRELTLIKSTLLCRPRLLRASRRTLALHNAMLNTDKRMFI